MNYHRQEFLRRKVVFNTKLLPHESPVQAGLSFTPAEMLRMTEKGLPISPLSTPENMYSDSDHTSGTDFGISPMEERGATMAGLWEQQQDARTQIINARSKGAFKKKGEENATSSDS